MPVKNGFEAASDIRKLENLKLHRNSIPIIALTASTFPEEIEKAIKSGMNECISKPTTKPVIEEVISRYLNNNNKEI